MGTPFVNKQEKETFLNSLHCVMENFAHPRVTHAFAHLIERAQHQSFL